MIIQSLVISRIDYSHALFVGAPKYVMNRLQRVQNMVARLVSGQGLYDHITETRFDLHWLPVIERVHFKVLLLTYKAMNNLAPSYLTELLNIYKPGRTLRPRSNHMLVIPKTKGKTYDKSFYYMAPVLWNNLPTHIRSADTITSFRSLLKTHLFRNTYPDFVA